MTNASSSSNSGQPIATLPDTLPAPQTSYGMHKLVCEHLVADYTRTGYVDGRAARLMTVTVRPVSTAVVVPDTTTSPSSSALTTLSPSSTASIAIKGSGATLTVNV